MRYLLITSYLIWPLLAYAGEVQREFNPQTGIERVQVEHPGFSLRLLPLAPDYVTAVFSARGLPQDIVDATQAYCTFGTILKNIGQQPLHYRLTDWRYVTPDGKTHYLKTKTQWLEEWKDRSLAFRWILLHEEQTYQPGDWGQGFTTLPLPAGSQFDLYYSWTQGDKTHEEKLEAVHCAPLEAPDPDA